MNRAMSIYLDLVRFIAAVMVFHNHAAYARFDGRWLRPRWGTFGNDAVMVFFVLSGFVIAHVARRPDLGLRTFLVHRASRLWSVVIPALVATVLLDAIGQSLDPELYQGWWYKSDEPVRRFLRNALFLNQLWFDNVRAFSNGPFWSIGYEFWYYVAFGAWFFVNGRWRWLTLGLACLVMGPRLLVLFPIWMLGFALYRLCGRVRLPSLLGGLAFVGSLVLYGLFREYEVSDQLLDWTYEQLGKKQTRDFFAGYTERFLGDYVLAGIVALNFLGFASISERVEPVLGVVERPIRALADFTFTIYLFHYPLLMAAYAWTQDSVQTIALTCLAIVPLGFVGEKQKAWWRRQVQGLVDRVGAATRW